MYSTSLQRIIQFVNRRSVSLIVSQTFQRWRYSPHVIHLLIHYDQSDEVFLVSTCSFIVSVAAFEPLTVQVRRDSTAPFLKAATDVVGELPRLCILADQRLAVAQRAGPLNRYILATRFGWSLTGDLYRGTSPDRSAPRDDGGPGVLVPDGGEVAQAVDPRRRSDIDLIAEHPAY